MVILDIIDTGFTFRLLLIPALTAFTGWLVIRLSLYLLFKPVLPRKVFGFTVQGLLPRNQQHLAQQAGRYAASSFSFDTIEEKIRDPKIFEQVKPLIETHIDDFLRNKLKEQMPMISMFIGDKTIQTLKTVFIQEIQNMFPQVMSQFTGQLKTELNIGAMVTAKLESVSPALIAKTVSQKTNKLALFGGLIGLLIGIIQFILLQII